METDAAGFFVNAVDPADLDVDELKGEHIVYKWPGLGWIHGRVTRRPPNRHEKDDDGDVISWWVKFEGESFETGCALEEDLYNNSEHADDGEWWVVAR
eukprot:1011156-Prymnesium_polylepis.1